MTMRLTTDCERHNGYGTSYPYRDEDCKTCAVQRIAFTAPLAAMSDGELRKACNQYIWLSAYASNNPRSAYHWMCDATYDECKKRGKVDEIYSTEHKALMREAQGR